MEREEEELDERERMERMQREDEEDARRRTLAARAEAAKTRPDEVMWAYAIEGCGYTACNGIYERSEDHGWRNECPVYVKAATPFCKRQPAAAWIQWGAERRAPSDARRARVSAGLASSTSRFSRPRSWTDREFLRALPHPGAGFLDVACLAQVQPLARGAVDHGRI